MLYSEISRILTDFSEGFCTLNVPHLTGESAVFCPSAVIRLAFPPLTEERRKALVKDVKATAENAKVAIRNIRRDSIEKLKTMKKNSEITEDDLKFGEGEVQKITDDFIKQVDSVASAKEAEIMEI